MVIKAHIAPFAALLALAGCTVGPDFAPPKVDAPATWQRSHSAATEPSKADETLPVDPEWWKLLGDPVLNRLVAQVAQENLDVLAATARLEESRAERGIAAADLFPRIDGNASYTRQKLSNKGVISVVEGGSGGATSAAGSAMGIPNSAAIPPFNTYQYGFDASWELDLWGRIRRNVESADATLQASEDARRAGLLSSTAELVSDYVQLRGVQASIRTTRNNLSIARQETELTRERAKGGLGNDLDVADAAAQAASVNAELPQMEQQQIRWMNAIALLLGKPPGALQNELSAPGTIPPVPPQVPVGVPSQLARRRPDIREAEDQLHSATAQIGVAKADFFPQVTLMGDGALQSITFSDLNSWAARDYSFGPSITLPIFEGGRLKSTLEMRNARQREAAITYRKTVLNAFHEVDNALTALRAEQNRHAALVAAAGENAKALTLSTERYRQGLSTFLDVLTAERSLLDSQQQVITSTQTESVNMVQLYKALGGGWETRFPLPATPAR